jgi:hypothetical protein
MRLRGACKNIRIRQEPVNVLLLSIHESLLGIPTIAMHKPKPDDMEADPKHGKLVDRKSRLGVGVQESPGLSRTPHHYHFALSERLFLCEMQTIALHELELEAF